MLISELCQALTETADQDVANTRAAAEMEVHLLKELLEAKHRLAELEPAWEMFIAKHNDEEEAQDLEQRRRAAVAAQPSERRNRRLKNEATRVELLVAASMPPSDAAASTSHLATPRGADNDLSGARDPGSASTLGMFSPAVSIGLDSPREPDPSTATVDSGAARITAAFNTGACKRRIRRARVLPRRISCVEKSLSQTLCARPHSLTSRRRHRKPSAISSPTTRMHMRRSRIWCPTSQKPTRNDTQRSSLIETR